MIKKYASLVRFPHTVFALPFALLSYVFALTSTGTSFSAQTLILILVAMVAARNAAMGFNRWADREIDSANPRTADREIPAGKIKPQSALVFVAINAALFIASAALLNRLCFALSPLALLLLLGYSYTKRFTAWSHIVLGMTLAAAPVGAYIAVTGSLSLAPVVLAALVLSWVAGFDILYSRSDADFDRSAGLHSVPARFSPRAALSIAVALHVVSAYSTILFGLFTSRGLLFWIGSGLFLALLIAQYFVPRGDRSRGLLSWDNLNGAGSLLFAAFAIADLVLG